MSKPRFRPTKFRALVRYLIQRQTESIQPCTVERLHVMLYLIEFEHFERFGKGISNPTFIRGPLYPECVQLEDVLRELLQNGLIDTSPLRDYFSMA